MNRNKDDKKKSNDNFVIAKKNYSEVEESKKIFTNYFALFERKVIYKEMKRVIKKFLDKKTYNEFKLNLREYFQKELEKLIKMF